MLDGLGGSDCLLVGRVGVVGGRVHLMFGCWISGRDLLKVRLLFVYNREVIRSSFFSYFQKG